VSSELTEAERAAVNAAHWYCRHGGPATGTDSLCQDCENIARAIVAVVAPIIRRETLDRFGDRMGTFNPPLSRVSERGNGALNDPSIFSDNP
jgi:hypothetical protein